MKYITLLAVLSISCSDLEANLEANLEATQGANQDYYECCLATHYEDAKYCEKLVYPIRVKKQEEKAAIWKEKVAKLKALELQEARQKAGILWK